MPRTQTTPSGQRNERSREVAESASDERGLTGELLMEHFTQYAREKPEVVTLWAFGIGFILGWKLKPW